ncbi:MAG TPA: toxin TcdB middle/N-terminal domain-containing protein [Solirubrobacteraceae bacterium]
MTDGSVECWPSLGHGRFAPVVRMDGVPRLGDDFDPARVHLADVDGSGAAALVYAYVDRVELFRNLGGNSFAALPVTVKLPAGYSRPEQIRFEDLLGNGYQCLVFATEDPAPQLWCIDLCGGTKPYLLSSFDNGQGKRTRADYRSSAHYMLLDRSDGLEWVTRLPFPIQVVARVVSDDAASGVRTAVSYRYHHGHYDDTEREFRGFGMVEHTDVEVDSLAGGAAASHTIPLLTKRWFHTGVWAAEAALERAYATEYYSGDPKAWPALESVLDLDAQPHVNTSRQAAVALSGRLLREERYGLDGSDAAAVPYDVAQQSYRVVLLQPATGDDYGAFFAHEEEAVEAHYERDPADPLVHQHFVFALDAYGDVTLESSVACPRRPAAPDPAGGQSSARIVATERAWIALTGDPDTWLLGEPASHKASEVHGAAAPDVKGLYYSRVALLAQVTAALGGSGPPTATPVDWYRYVYEDDAVSGAPITPQALLLRREEAVFTDALVTQLFAGQTLDGSLATFLQNQGGYRLDADGFWWNPSAADQYGGADAFYQPTSTTDAIATAGGPASGTVVDYTYDSHGLLLTGTAMRTSGGDVLPSAITATLLDYVALAACRIRDENGTVHEAVRDPLGLVVAVSSYGSEWGGEGERQVGFAPLDMDAPPTVPPSIDALVAAPAAYIAGAASYVYVDLDAWRAGRGPTAVAELTASAYPQGQVPGGEVQIAVTHQDGSRRVLQRARLAEPSAETTTRWRVSARVRYDAKGLAFAEWEPFFAQTCAFVQDAELTGRPAFSATYYDALDRMVRVETPKGSFSDAFFATRAYAAWSTTTADQNDTVKDSRYYGYYVTEGHPGLGRWDIDALEKAAAHYGTPNTVGHDNLGHPSALRRLLTAGGSPLVETSACDTEGNELWAADPRLGAAGVRNIERTYTLTNQVVCLSSVDAGTRWVLRDAVGNPIYQYDSRGFAMVSQYDGRQRLIAVHVTGGDGAAALDTIVELRIYGDSLDSNRNPPLADPASRNLVGREWHGYDSAGLTEHASFSLSGQPLATTSWTRSAYNQEADWALPSAPDWATRTQALAAALDTAEPQAQSWTYDALGRALERVDAAGNVRTATFHVSGLLDTIGWTVSGGSARPYVTGTSYTAHERPLTVTLANVSGTPVIATTYSYDPMTYRVSGVTAARLADAAVLQQLTYHFDPVGNLTHVENGVTLAPGSPPGDGDHTFDALYRLIASSGRVMDGYTQMVERGAGYEPFFRGDGPPGAETYSAIYSYDDGDNLTDATYTAPSSSWTTKLAVSPASNRAVPAEGRVEPDPAVGIFDGNGNLTALDGVDSIEWSYANQVRRVVAGAQTQYSLYDTRGNRVARIVESNDSQVVQKTVYVGALERCSRISGGVVVEQVDRARIVSSGPATVGVLETWSVGAAPTGATTAWFQLSDLVDSAVVEVGDEGDVRHHEEYLPYGGTALAWSPHGEADMALKIRRHGARERDATSGLYDYGWRQYACWLGRWTSPDPTFDADGLNLYAFAQCNPVTMTDRFGLGRDNKAKVRRKTFQNVRHVHERRVQSSRFRFFRRVQRAYGGTRNIAMIKLVKGSGKGRKVLYLLARSMGIGVHKLTLGGEEVITAAGSLMKRSHSEAVLRAALEVGTVKVGTKKFNLGGFSPVYAASTNEGCGAAHENCSEQSVPYLAPRFIFANKYQESAQAAGFEKLNNQHERDVANLSDYGSDAESESEYETAVADEDQFVGLDLSSGTLPAITATSMKDFLEEGPKQRKSKIRPLKS